VALTGEKSCHAGIIRSWDQALLDFLKRGNFRHIDDVAQLHSIPSNAKPGIMADTKLPRGWAVTVTGITKTEIKNKKPMRWRLCTALSSVGCLHAIGLRRRLFELSKSRSRLAGKENMELRI